MWAIERINEPFSIVCPCPARCLYGSGNLQSQHIKILLTLIEGNLPLAHQPPEISVSGNIIEPMIMDADVRNMWRHEFNSFRPANLEESLLARGVELEQSRAELESLRPFSPPPRGIFALRSEDRRSSARVPGFFDAE